ncbi:MAG: zinc ribbon domain-containing protein [Oscillospiraceae bacterium]|nr:zinc ribbon domain-containing protein [Oscillospiraceae bacterium]
MTYSFNQVIKDKNLIKTLAEAAKRHSLTITDYNIVFFFDFSEQSLLTNHRKTYDRLMELGGEKLLRKLLKEGSTCLTNDPNSAKQGIRPIQGTDKFFLQTNAGDPKVMTSILFDIAGWAAMDRSFDTQSIELAVSDISEESEEPEWFWEESEPESEEQNALEFPSFYSQPSDKPDGEFERVECLKESEDGLTDTCIIKKDGWWAVAEIDMRGMPKISRMCTPFAFTSITRNEKWLRAHLLVERFGKKGVYNWEDNTYPVPCRYDSISLYNPESVSMYKVSTLNESHVVGFWGGWLKYELPPCPKCGAAQVKDAVYCHKCGAALLEEPKQEKTAAPEPPKAAAVQPTPAPTPVPAPQPQVQKTERRLDPDVPTLGSVGPNKEFSIRGSSSQVNSYGRLLVTLRMDDEYYDDTDPEHFLYGSLDVMKKEGGEWRKIGKLSDLSAYALAEDGIFYSKLNQICFMNIYGEVKILGNQDKVIRMTNNGNGTLTVEYVKSYSLYEANSYSCPMDMWEYWHDIYDVDIGKREFTY